MSVKKVILVARRGINPLVCRETKSPASRKLCFLGQQKHKLFLFAFVLFLFMAFLLNHASYQTALSEITGTASSTATVSFCYNNPPAITSIPDQTNTVGDLFTYQVNATDLNANAYLTYSDDTSLFDINQSGAISFTSQSADVGTHTIAISVDDNSSCPNGETTETFSLVISAAAAEEEEEEAVAAGPSGAGGGGGFRTTPIKLSYQLSQEILKVILKESQKLERKIAINNNGTVDLRIEIENPLDDLIYITPASFDLMIGETRDIFLIFNYKQNASLGVHSGQATIRSTYKSARITKSLALILEVESKEVLIDASLDILKKTLLPDEELKATITLFNIKRIIPAEVTLTYLLSDFKQSIIYEEKEIITLEEQASFSKTIPLPEGIKPGQYLLSLNIQHATSFATASELFEIKSLTALEELAGPLIEKPAFILSIPIMLLAIMVILAVLFVIVFFVHKRVKTPRIVLKPDLDKLRRKLSLLKESFGKGFIKEKTYKVTKRNLEKLIRKKSQGR